MTTPDPIAILRDRLREYEEYMTHRDTESFGMIPDVLPLRLRTNIALECAAYLPALLDELEQLRGIVAHEGAVLIGEFIRVYETFRSQNERFAVDYDMKTISGGHADIFSALAWLRSDIGKQAVEAARKAAQ